MNPIDYLHFQLRLEGKDVTGDRCLRQVEIVPGEDMPMLLIAQFADGNRTAYFDETLDPALRTELSRKVPEIRFPELDPLLDVLQEYDISFDLGHYKTYVFPFHYAEFTDREVICRFREDAKVVAFGFGDFAKHVYVVERDGRIASACASVRENDACGEAWVFTDPDYRRQGLAPKVVGAWAGGLMSEGKVPLYSHKIQNNASANLAKRLGLLPVFEEIAVVRLANESKPE